jgi:CheY-like chemotaxis protein
VSHERVGFEALQALRADPQTREIPVIALTEAASARERERGVQAGFHAYRTKPIQVDVLLSELEALFARPGS